MGAHSGEDVSSAGLDFAKINENKLGIPRILIGFGNLRNSFFLFIDFCKTEPRARDILSIMSSPAAFDEDVSSAGLDFTKTNENKQRIRQFFALEEPLQSAQGEIS